MLKKNFWIAMSKKINYEIYNKNFFQVYINDIYISEFKYVKNNIF